MTAEEFRAARAAFGLSAEGMARLVGVHNGKTVRRWASGESDVPGPVGILLQAMLDSESVRRHFGVSLVAEGV